MQLRAIALISFLVSVPASATQFTFDTLTPGTATTFDYTVDGVTATFSSPDGPVFITGPSFFDSLTGQALFDNDPGFHTLIISFTQPTNFLSLNFALNTQSTGALFYSLFSGGTGGLAIDSGLASGTVPDGFPFPEGVLSVSTGSFFDTVVLSSNVSDFAIDNVTTSEVPEPATSATLLLGLAIVAAAARRRLRS
jgi:hypothetical protein